MRYIISDIHGEYDLFIQLLNSIEFTSEDTLFVCGDIIEKGKHSIKLAKLISKMSNVKCIAGNHEYTFLKYYRGIMRDSPSDFNAVLRELQKYFPDDGELLDWELVDWFESLPFYIEENDFICTHAGVPLDHEGRILPLANATPEQLVYDRKFKDRNTVVTDSRCVFFGHTPTSALTNEESRILAYLRPKKRGDCISDFYKVHLDLGTWLSGKLGCFCIETCKCYYVGLHGDDRYI